MAITAAQVKELREKTGVGMMECKNALTENDGDMEKAILWLRERGMSRAAKKAGRVTAEGLVEVLISQDQKCGVVVEVNCETDFVSKNDDFQNFAKEAASLALSNKAATVEELKGLKMSTGLSVDESLTALIAKIGENLQVRRVEELSVSNGVVAGYIHMGGKIGSLVALEGKTGPDVEEAAKDLAMHVAAASPRYLTSSEVNQDELEQEQDLARKRLIEEGKPENMIDKIMVGQMNKFYKEVCLIDQPFIKDPKVSVKEVASKVGATVAGFKRFQLGEGVEKKADDFADEVAKMTKK